MNLKAASYMIYQNENIEMQLKINVSNSHPLPSLQLVLAAHQIQSHHHHYLPDHLRQGDTQMFQNLYYLCSCFLFSPFVGGGKELLI
jgi:hypothetical protein